MFDYKLENGKTIRINEKTINNLMTQLDLSREDAIQVYLEDEGYEINEEQEELTQKAKDNKITASIHKAESKTKERKKIERKPNPDKEDLIALIADFLNTLGGINEVTDIQVTNIGKIIEFNFRDKAMKIDLVEKRVKKN